MKKDSAFKLLFARPEVSLIIADIGLVVIFTFFSDSFLTAYNFFNMSRTAAMYALIGIGQAMVLIVGGMNLSLGQIGGLTVVVAGYMMDVLQQPIGISIVAGLMVGLACGLFNGLIITMLRLNSFVVTLATSFVYSGLINGISRGYPYINIPANISFMGRGGVGFVPYLIIFVVVALILVAYFFKFTITGRELLATGGNAEAAKMSAVNTDAKIMLANIASGIFASIAGLLWISRTGSAQPGAGADWMLISFAVAVIGGTSLKGGVISPIGIFFASYLIVMVKNGLVMLDANIYFEQVYLGLILLLAVSIESIRYIIQKRRLAQQLKNAQFTSKA